MRKPAAQRCKSEAKRLCEAKGMPYSKRVYRAVKEYYNSIPRPLRSRFKVAL